MGVGWGGGGGGGGGQGVNLINYLDSSHMVSQYVLIHSKAVKAINKGDIGQNVKIGYFVTPV